MGLREDSGKLLVTGASGGGSSSEVDATIVASNITIPVSLISSPLPVGASTEAKQDTGNISLSSILGQLDVALSSRASQATLASVLAQLVAALDVTLSSRASQATLASVLAALDVALSTRLAETTFTTRIPVVGQKAMAASIPVTLASNQSGLAVTGTFWQATQPVSGTFFQGTQPISASSLPLPTGAATEATLAGALTLVGFNARINTLGQKTKVNSTPVTLASDQDALPVTGTFWQATQPVSGTFWQATQPISLTTLPAGTNNIGDVDIISIAAGDNNIGNVDVVSSALPTGASTSAKQDTGNTSLGSIDTKLSEATTSAITSVNDSATSISLLATNANRKGATFHNDSTEILYLKLGTTASLTSFSARLLPNGYYEIPSCGYTGAIDGIWAANASGAVRITELT